MIRLSFALQVTLLALLLLVPTSARAQNGFLVSPFMTDALLVDNNGNDQADAGDSIRMTAIVTNVVNTADELHFRTFTGSGETTTLLDANVTLVVGSVTTTIGTVLQGNTAGHTDVEVQVGDLASGHPPLTITFDLLIKSPLGNGIDQVASGGVWEHDNPLAGNNSPLPTQDPDNGNAAATRTVLGPRPTLAATLSDALLVDLDANGLADPGDSIRYTLSVTETAGTTAATSLQVNVPVASGLTLVTSSVMTTSGTISTGSGPGDTTIVVDLASLPPSTAVTLTFDQTVSGPTSQVQVSLQGSVTASGVAALVTDDPDEGGDQDPTVTVLAAPAVTASMTASFQNDVDGDGFGDPGDVVLYTVTITETADVDSPNTRFTITPSAGSTLVPTFVTTTQGTVTTGNGGGDTSVQVDLGTLQDKGSATITFRASVDSPVSQSFLSAQGTVSGDELSSVLTDDPGQPGSQDPTTTPLQGAGAPNLSATMADSLSNDPAGDGKAQAGDTVRYTVVITERDGAPAQDVVFTHPAVSDAALVVGSVVTSQGTVTTGNTGGDTTVSVNVGGVAGNGTATIRFDVLIDDPTSATQLSAQGAVNGSNFTGFSTQDPDASGATLTPIFGPARVVEMTDTFLLDNGTTGTLDHNDQIRFETTVNPLNGTILSAEYTVPETTGLQISSVFASQGTAQRTAGGLPNDFGNGAFFDLGDVTSLVSIRIDYTFNSSNAPSVVPVQGTLASSNFSDILSDDPSAAGATDPTTVAANPSAGVAPFFTLADALQVDVGSDGELNPGDTLRYTAEIRAQTGIDNVVFFLPTIQNTQVVAGSVVPSAGTVTQGNGGGVTPIEVDVGNIPFLSTRTIRFDLIVDDPLTVSSTQISAQATMDSDQTSILVSDDPGTGGSNEPTVTPLISPAIETEVRVSMTDALATDTAPAGFANTGDVIHYTVVVTEASGNTAFDAELQMDLNDFSPSGPVTGLSIVSTTQGSTSQNGPTTVTVDLGNITGSSSATVVVSATLTGAIPGGTTSIEATSFVTGSNFAQVQSDDPDRAGSPNPTQTLVGAQPVITATMADALQTDGNSDGNFDPGDTIRYTVVVTAGNSEDTQNLVFTLPSITGTRVVTGSVTQDHAGGSVTTGNTPGDSTVVVNLGAVNNGDTPITITFDLQILDPPPDRLTEISAQGTLSADNLQADVVTDDPDDPNSAFDFTVSTLDFVQLTSTLRDLLSNDRSSDGDVDPGDTLTYTWNVSSSGSRAATSVVLTLTPAANTQLVTGSVTTPIGSVVTGNTAGDTSIQVDLGSPAFSSSHDIVFQLLVGAPLGAGVTELSQQGTIASDQPSFQTNDPDTADASDPTTTTLTRGLLSASMSDVLTVDNNSNSTVNPGDVLEYTVVLSNPGNGTVHRPVFRLTPSTNTSLVVGSVATPGDGTSSITRGNLATHTTVEVFSSPIAAGLSRTLRFRLGVDTPVPLGTTQVTAQGTASVFHAGSDGSGAAEFSVSTDDPDLGGTSDPTTTSVSAAPVVTATLVDAHQVDNDSDGDVDPTDTVRYTLQVTNSGDTPASTVVVSSTPDGDTKLVVGSVSVSQGSVTTGNTGGDTVVGLALGNIAASATATATFDVTVNTPFPVGDTQVQTLAVITGANFGALVSDDPAAAGMTDPTTTAIVASPTMTATLVDSLFIDVNSDTNADAGDSIQYTAVVSNTGDQDAAGARFTLTPDANAPLEVGTVVAAGSTIVSGNTAGDTSVEVLLGTVAATGSKTITFRSTVRSPLATSVVSVSTQGSVTGTNFADLLTDDPTPAGGTDPTTTTISRPLITATLVDALQTDNDSDSNVDPGDTVRYTLVVTNAGNEAADTVVVTASPDANSALVVGSVTSTQGTITTGNTGGDTSVRIDLASFAPGTLTITFDVTVNSPLAVAVTQLSVQGLVAGADFANVNTDDPAVGGASDPTLTPVIRPDLTPTLTDTLQVDGDSDTVPDPGDTLRYTAVITNNGNEAATGVALTLTPDANTALSVGSVSTTSGTVTTGNTAGDTTVAIAVGTLAPGGGAVTIVFDVVVDNPYPVAAPVVTVQGNITGTNLAASVTDDPDVGGATDPTATTITVTPDPTATLTDALIIDNNSNNVANPGDRIGYTASIGNVGDTTATALIFDLVPDANTALVVGSVSTTQGTVTTGNTAGDTIVGINVGNTAASASITVTFAVNVNASVPAGTTQVTARGTVSGGNFTTFQSDDPDTIPADATLTSLIARPIITATMSAGLAVDVDGDGLLSAGDKGTYTISMTNTGNTSGAGMIFRLTPDPNTNLSVGSVTTTTGTVTTGNNPGNTTVEVAIGGLRVGGMIMITVDVTAPDPIPVGVTQVTAQGVVSGSNFTDVLTDDPDTSAIGDATTVLVEVIRSASPADGSPFCDLNPRARPPWTALVALVMLWVWGRPRRRWRSTAQARAA